MRHPVTNSEQNLGTNLLTWLDLGLRFLSTSRPTLVEAHMQRLRLPRGPIILVVFLLYSALACFAQTATALRGSNLRKAPSTSSTILETLKQGDSVTLTSSRKRSGLLSRKCQRRNCGLGVGQERLNLRSNTRSGADTGARAIAGPDSIRIGRSTGGSQRQSCSAPID